MIFTQRRKERKGKLKILVDWKKDIVDWKVGRTLYLSIAFTWLLPKAEAMALAHKGPVIAGGPAVKLMGAPWATETPEAVPYDVLAMHNPLATFTTRGCVRKCDFCAVPKIEGKFREIKDFKPAPIICDNNILAASDAHFRKVINSLKPFPYVDFNQGLDARLFNRKHAFLLSTLKAVKVRFSFDSIDQETKLADAIELARRVGLKDISVYVLIGFNDSPEDARYRLELVRSWGIRPWPMRYQPLDTFDKNNYVARGWTQKELMKMVRYYAHLQWFEFFPYEDYRGGQSAQGDLFNSMQ